MSKKKSGTRRAAPKKRKIRRPAGLGPQLVKSVLGIGLLVCLVVAAGWLVHHLLTPKPPARTVPASEKAPAARRIPSKKTDAFEVYPKKDVPVRPPLPSPREIPAGKRPKIAIIIDDLGEDRGMAEKFFSLEGVLTFSFLPTGTHQSEIVRKAREAGLELMLHLPMEPLEFPEVNPGAGALLMTMTPDSLIEQLNHNIDAVPGAKGVNNHMGSRMTAESSQMYQVFSVLRKRNLYFIDSRTTPETVCRPSARLFDVRFAQRDIFIDNIQKPGAIRKQLEKLEMVARSHGEAVGIAHPYPVTYQVLREMLPRLKEGFTMVPASEIVHEAG